MDTITNRNGQFQSAVGPDAVRAYGLRVLISGLNLEIRAPGLRFSRGQSALSQAKALTGLKTNDRAKQVEALTRLFNEQVAKCEIVND